MESLAISLHRCPYDVEPFPFIRDHLALPGLTPQRPPDEQINDDDTSCGVIEYGYEIDLIAPWARPLRGKPRTASVVPGAYSPAR